MMASTFVMDVVGSHTRDFQRGRRGEPLHQLGCCQSLNPTAGRSVRKSKLFMESIRNCYGPWAAGLAERRGRGCDGPAATEPGSRGVTKYLVDRKGNMYA